MEIKKDKEINFNELNKLFVSVGWPERTKDEWRKALKKSSHVVSILNENKIIGFGRIVEDGVMCMFYDIIVSLEAQGKGVGKKIMNSLLEDIKDKKYWSIGLFYWEKNEKNKKFYESFGFKVVGNGMKLILE